MRYVLLLLIALILFALATSCGDPDDCFIGVEDHYYQCDEHNYIELETIEESGQVGIIISTNVECWRVWVYYDNIEWHTINTGGDKLIDYKVINSVFEKGKRVVVAIDVNATGEEIILD